MRKMRLLALLLCVLLLCGCARQEVSENIPDLILRYADNQPEDYPTTKAAEYFAQLVEERTHGKILIRIFPNGELGDENRVLEQVQFGGIDMARISMGTLSDFYPGIEVLTLPYLYNDADHMWRVLDGDIGDSFLASSRQADVIGLSWYDAGARSFYTREQITCLEDLKGLKIRVQESDLMHRMVECLGAVPVEIQYGEVYSALQTGKIDGAENNWPSYESTGHFEAAPYFLLDEHSRLPEMQIISTVAWDKIAEIDEDYVTIIMECAKESAIYERQLWKEREEESEQRVRALGGVVMELSDAELLKFRQAVQPLYENYPENIQRIITRIRES